MSRGDCQLLPDPWEGCCCRADTLRRAIVDRLLPSFMVELRAKLLADAQDAVLSQVSDKLWDWASQAPTQVRPCTTS